MATYLSYKFIDDLEFIRTFDEAPLWSARFGFLLLDHILLQPGQTIVDIGSGAGFPLIELSERAGVSCRIYGIDPWQNANSRAQQKIRSYGVSNIQLIEQSADQLPFEADSVDLITSNLGINNFEDPDRVLKPQGKIALTTNPNGHWKEFYGLFEETLESLNERDIYSFISTEQKKRGSAESLTKQLKRNGFRDIRSIKETFFMNFVDGTSFLNHHFVKCGWLGSWLKLFPPDKREVVFSLLEQNLNQYAVKHNGLKLTVPMLFMEGCK